MVADSAAIWKVLEEVKDPEIPALNVREMGIVRDVALRNGHWHVIITPTYSGCPAMDTIAKDIHAALHQHHITAQVDTVLSPAWTTDWMTPEAHQKLRSVGIAPPQGNSADVRSLLGKEVRINCPNCGSENTRMVSAFGSTACKALYSCNACQDPFDYFKCL